VQVRVYVLQAVGLTPQDPNGKADPFLVVKLGDIVFGRAELCIKEELNPKFHAVYEFSVVFPGESVLTVRFGCPLLSSPVLSCPLLSSPVLS
jgi:hypothetical protein